MNLFKTKNYKYTIYVSIIIGLLLGSDHCLVSHFLLQFITFCHIITYIYCFEKFCANPEGRSIIP